MTTKNAISQTSHGSSKTEVAPSKQEIQDQAKRARNRIDPRAQAAITIHESVNQKVDFCCLHDELTRQVEAVNRGDMRRAEAILITQAHTLDELFNTLARSAGRQNNLKPRETYLRLAFKAQAQCRATLETLVAIKNPPVVFAKQANINQGGNQQVNNGIPAPSTHAGEINGTQRNELFVEAHHGSEKMDTRTAGAAIGPDQSMATVGKIHGG